MKKAFGMMVLAGLPVACGTTLPSTPAAPETAPTTETGTVSSQTRIVDPCVISDDEETLARIEVVQVDTGRGWVRVRARGLRTANGSVATRCSVPTWSATPLDGVISLTADGSGNATLTAVPGKYDLTVRVVQENVAAVGRLRVAVQ